MITVTVTNYIKQIFTLKNGNIKNVKVKKDMFVSNFFSENNVSRWLLYISGVTNKKRNTDFNICIKGGFT